MLLQHAVISTTYLRRIYAKTWYNLDILQLQKEILSKKQNENPWLATVHESQKSDDFSYDEL